MAVIRHDPKFLMSINNILALTHVRKVHSYLSLASYYRRFVPGFAKIAAPLHGLLYKDARWDWSEGCQGAFDELKEHILAKPIAIFSNFTQLYRLFTDVSMTGLGAILAQVQGREWIACCISCLINSSERNYWDTKLECLAMVWVIQKFRNYLIEMTLKSSWITTHCNS